VLDFIMSSKIRTDTKGEKNGWRSNKNGIN
jgi:hypothetical protein